MKLRAARIAYISNEILKILESEEFIEINNSEKALGFVQKLFTDDLLVEEQLEEEVRELLERYSETMNQDRIEYHEMFKMVKTKLAKERNLIL